jgi:hypothetical protein
MACCTSQYGESAASIGVPIIMLVNTTERQKQAQHDVIMLDMCGITIMGGEEGRAWKRRENFIAIASLTSAAPLTSHPTLFCLL